MTREQAIKGVRERREAIQQNETAVSSYEKRLVETRAKQAAAEEQTNKVKTDYEKAMEDFAAGGLDQAVLDMARAAYSSASAASLPSVQCVSVSDLALALRSKLLRC